MLKVVVLHATARGLSWNLVNIIPILSFDARQCRSGSSPTCLQSTLRLHRHMCMQRGYCVKEQPWNSKGAVQRKVKTPACSILSPFTYGREVPSSAV